MYITKFTVTTTLSLLSLGIIISNPVNACTLWVGRYGSFVRDINLVGFIPESKLREQSINSKDRKLSTVNQNRIEKNLINKIDALASAKPLKEQIEKDYDSFDTQVNANNSNVEDGKSKNDLIEAANSEEINKNIEERYQGLIETNSDKIDLITANKLIEDLSDSSIDSQAQIKSTLDNIDAKENNELFSKSLTAGIFLAIGGSGFIILIPILNAFGLAENRFFGLFGDGFGRPKVPETAIALHDRSFKKISNLATKAEQIDDEKFGKKEFVLYIQLRNKVAKGVNEYQQICQSIQYLEVAIAASSSYLKIEQTELRYRSRKQQAFYQYVIDNIADDIDGKTFRNRVKSKLAEILPLINSDEGSKALKTYLVEINKISQHDLGLKLLALFKKYQLADFAILRKVSDIVEQINAHDVLSDKNLMVIILENYEILEKLAPIIGIEKENVKPETFTKILQYMGLVRRHEKSFQQFQELIKVLKKCQKPYRSLKLVREQYPVHQYRVPKEFSQKIPGLNTYQKYEKYLDDY